MPEPIFYADLWALLRKLGFDCDTVLESNHRVCEFSPTDTRITLHNYPPNQPFREQILFGVLLQLDNGGVMTPEEFDRWAYQKARANARNGAKINPCDLEGSQRYIASRGVLGFAGPGVRALVR
jgi:hypothetical protein